MTFQFKRGTHRARPLYWLKWWPLLITTQVVRKVVFPVAAIYDLQNEDQYDVNKLFGISFSLNPHKNSVRFGWRYDEVPGKFMLYAYSYKRGTRSNVLLCECEIDREYECFIHLTEHGTTMRVVDSTRDETVGTYHIGDKKRSFGFLLGPYFGGNKPAPHDMTINLSKI